MMSTSTTESEQVFRFKQFAVAQDRCTMKVGTDGVLLGAWAGSPGAQNILDIGTGTGLIALMLAQRCPLAQVDAVEIDPAAAAQAAENAAQSPWADRLRIVSAAIQDFAANTSPRYDLIVSNPPFFSGGTLSDKDNRSNVRHTIKLSHKDLLSVARNMLVPDGHFCVVLPYLEGLRFRELAAAYHLYATRITHVRPTAQKNVARLLLQFEHQQNDCMEDELVIQAGGRNEWTEDYMALTGGFYLNMA